MAPSHTENIHILLQTNPEPHLFNLKLATQLLLTGTRTET